MSHMGLGDWHTFVLAGSPKRLGLAHSSGSGPSVLSSANSALEPIPPLGTSRFLGVCTSPEM